MLSQAGLDRQAAEESRARYWRAVRSSDDRDDTESAPHKRALLTHLTAPLEHAIGEWLSYVPKTGACRRLDGEAYRIVREVPPAASAYITLATVLRTLDRQRTATALAAEVGAAVNEEARLHALRRLDRVRFNLLLESAGERVGYVYRRQVFAHYLNTHGLLPEYRLGAAERTAVGLVFLELLVQTCDLVEWQTARGPRGPRDLQRVLVPTQAGIDWVRQYHAHNEYARPFIGPRVTPAPDWSDLYARFGAEEFPAFPVIKHAHALGANRASDLAQVYAALNTLQHTAWRVNRRVYAVAEAVYRNNWSVAGMVGSELMPLPTKPTSIDTDPEARKRWRREAHQVHAANVPRRSKIIRTGATLSLASKYQHEPRIYFQYQIDFRGRAYTIQNFLTPQAGDLAKGMLEFADGETITRPEQAEWLMIHGANCYGVDKASLADRVGWVTAHEAEILGSAEDPLSHRFWAQADDPFQFLAFAFEWQAFKKSGLGRHITHLPVQIDGSNNGLQILSLLSRDEATGASTNCVPSEQPRDVYGDVARVLVAKLEQSDDPRAQFLLRLGVDRKTCKRPVMTTPYGLTFFSCKEYVIQWLTETAEAHQMRLTYAEIAQYGAFLAGLLWKSMGERIGRAKSVMAWLQACADAASRQDREVRWRTPSGFVACQRYSKSMSRRIKVYVLGKMCRVRTNEPSTQLDRRKQAAGIAPNFVHSLDAACLHLAVNKAARLGMKSLMVVHDSFGTLATRCVELGACVRSSYSGVFREDQLQHFADALVANGITVPPVPSYGTLDPEAVLDSEYFFA